jgi:hypothetical protein
MRIAVRTGSPVVRFATTAPIQMPGQTRERKKMTAANAMPLAGHTGVTWAASNASISPRRAARM